MSIKCNNPGCVHNTGYQKGKIVDSCKESRCTLDSPKRTEHETYWFCEDEVRYGDRSDLSNVQDDDRLLPFV